MEDQANMETETGNTEKKDPETPEERRGISIWATGLFIVGEMAGGGIVAMPNAVLQAGWAGAPLVVVAALLSGFTGAQLGHCWTILQDHWPEYHQTTRKPYPSIGERAVGPWMKHCVSVCIDITLFGVAIVFLLLASENIQLLIKSWSADDISYCIFLVIVAAALLPITFLESPKDFWFIMVGAMGCTGLAVILLLAGIGLDSSGTQAPHTAPSFRSFFLAFAVILFSYGGHAAFPTIQHDMKNPSKFNISVTIAYVIIVFLYLPVSVAGFYVYGDRLGYNILELIATNWLHQTVTLLITVHVVLSFVIVVNPLNLELEELFRIPHKFGWRRVLLRCGTMLLVLLVAETVPHFGAVLSLIGATTITLLTFIFPGLFHLRLTRASDTSWKNCFGFQWHELMINILIMAVGVIGGIASTYSAVYNLIFPSGGPTFILPCYVVGGGKN